ncbi:MAG: penicillin-binding protein [Nitrospirae bacterium CG08_land_8_20_14_0_20_52_24]|nr:MAG: penicillin-binding protein [Nitrospirae bacterium CG08_land_8_20_14_0_20_52_24]PIV84936.1 MAG: penicillin-binding protein [Nitrospirae bacterium CG17_big_fil_post_rev_8_21_14_2_50_50_9]
MKRPAKKKRWFRWMITGLVLLLVLVLSAAAGAGFLLYTQILHELPDVSKLKDYRPSLITTVYADNDEVAGKFYIERRILLPFSEIPDILVKAFIAIEDARFYQHGGIDFQGISRAFWANLRAKQITQGGSTITQQLAKTLFLSPERTIQRKIREILLALQIEKRFSKKEILELYLNQIYFGEGAYGVEAASETYFGKHVKDLSLSEAAMLAGLPKAPAHFDPYKEPDSALKRRSMVLVRMYGEHFISKDQMRAADAENIVLKKREKYQDVSAYFIEHVRRYLMERYGSQELYRSGLEVHTTLNLTMQRAAFQSLREGLMEYDKRHGYRGPIGHGSASGEESKKPLEAPLSRPQESRSVRVNDILEGTVADLDGKGAWVLTEAGKGFLPLEGLQWAGSAVRKKDPSDPAKTVWIKPKSLEDILSQGDRILVRVVRSVPGSSGLFFSLEQEPEAQGAVICMQPSTGEIKAMVGGFDFEKSEFNRAVQSRRQPGSAFKPLIYGAAMEKGFSPATIIIDAPIIFDQPGMPEKWKPSNYSEKFYGPTRLRVALAKSINVVTVKLLQRVGVRNVVDLAKRLGITSPLDKNYSLALGSSGVTLQELTSAYSVFANQGRRAEPYFIRRITDYDGKVIEQREPSNEDAVSSDVAYIMTSMLEEVVRNGTGWKMQELGRPSAGKTGTTNNFQDALYIGFVPDLIAGVWVGYDDMRSLGNGETGARAAAPIWLSFMRKATLNSERMPFPVPDDVVLVKIDSKTGLLPSSENQETYFECFRKGSEPREYASSKHTEGNDFFEMDSGSVRPSSPKETSSEKPAPDRL